MEPDTKKLPTPYVAHAQVAAMKTAGLTAAERLAAIMYATTADNETGISTYSQDYIASIAGVDRGVVCSALAKLKAAGFAVVIEKGNSFRRNSSHVDLSALVGIRTQTTKSTEKKRLRKAATSPDLRKFVDAVIAATAAVEKEPVTPAIRRGRTMLLAKVAPADRAELVRKVRQRVARVKPDKTLPVFCMLEIFILGKSTAGLDNEDDEAATPAAQPEPPTSAPTRPIRERLTKEQQKNWSSEVRDVLSSAGYETSGLTDDAILDALERHDLDSCEARTELKRGLKKRRDIDRLVSGVRDNLIRLNCDISDITEADIVDELESRDSNVIDTYIALSMRLPRAA